MPETIIQQQRERAKQEGLRVPKELLEDWKEKQVKDLLKVEEQVIISVLFL
jgi:hypothetical protein